MVRRTPAPRGGAGGTRFSSLGSFPTHVGTLRLTAEIISYFRYCLARRVWPIDRLTLPVAPLVSETNDVCTQCRLCILPGAPPDASARLDAGRPAAGSCGMHLASMNGSWQDGLCVTTAILIEG